MRKNFKVILDIDDVLLDCNEAAIRKLNAETGSNYTLEDITAWGILGNTLDQRLRYFQDPAFMGSLKPLDGAVEFVEALCKVAEVCICTSVTPECAGVRVQSILDHFPMIKANNIIIGNRKDLLKADVILDDGYHNLMNSEVRYPVLLRRPWNKGITGITSVSNYQEFLTLINIIKTNEYMVSPSNPKVVSLVGASGSGKNEIAKALLKTNQFKKVRSYTTRDHQNENYRFTPLSDFLQNKEMFAETSSYMGEYFGTKKEDIDEVIESGKKAILVLDINGAIAMKRLYGNDALNIYVSRDKSECIKDILQRNLSIDETVDRISSLDAEKNNEDFCDISLEYFGDIEQTINEIMKEVA